MKVPFITVFPFSTQRPAPSFLRDYLLTILMNSNLCIDYFPAQGTQDPHFLILWLLPDICHP